jgi:hypothetical protein
MSDQLCKGNRGKFGCQELVVDGGVDDSGFCEKCFWPGIVEATQKYEDLVAQGYSRVQAAEHSGLNEGETHHRLGTTPITTVEQDEEAAADVQSHDVNDVLGEDEEDNDVDDPT